MNPSPPILIYDRDTAFRETLKNFLLTAGYSEVEATATVRAALLTLHQGHFEYMLIGVSRSMTVGRCLASVARQWQPQAKIVYLVNARDQPFIKDASCATIIKEYVYSSLLKLIGSAAEITDNNNQQSAAHGGRG